MKVAILESLGISAEELAAHKAPFEKQGVTFAEYAKTTDPDTLRREIADADACIIANMPFPDDVIRAGRQLKYIDVAFTGVDHVGLTAAKEQGIAVSNAAGYSNEAVSELVIGMVLSLARQIREADIRTRSGMTKDGLHGWELKGKTVGIVGLGKIGSRSAQLFHAFDAAILSSSRTVHDNAPDYVEQVPLDDLLQRSDIVVLHCPANESTRGLINAEKLHLMKKTAILINAARGPVVVTADLVQALKDGTIAAAGIDVFDTEPPLSPEEPLLNAPGTLLTPHIAFATAESMSLRADIVFDNLKCWMEGKQKNIIL